VHFVGLHEESTSEPVNYMSHQLSKIWAQNGSFFAFLFGEHLMQTLNINKYITDKFNPE